MKTEHQHCGHGAIIQSVGRDSMSQTLKCPVFELTGLVCKASVSKKTQLVCSNCQKSVPERGRRKAERGDEREIGIVRLAERAVGADDTNEVVKKMALYLGERRKRMVEGRVDWKSDVWESVWESVLI